MTFGSFLFVGVLVCYLVSAVAYHAHLFTGNVVARRIAPVALIAGLLLHALALGGRWVDPQSPPMPPAVRTVSTAAWLLALTQLALDSWAGWASVGALSVPISFAAVLYANIVPRAPVTQNPALHSVLMRVHLTGVILGFAGFALAFCLAVVYLAQSAMLKRKHLQGPLRRLPPLESTATAAHWLAAIGFWMLTVGLITGSVVAMKVSRPTWYLEAPFLISLLAWCIYAVYIAASSLGGWRGRKTTYFLIGGFAVLLVAALINVTGPSPWVR